MAQNSEARKREFRRYLEREGVMEALTSALISLYEKADRPADPLAYFQRQLCKCMVPKSDHDSLKVTLIQNNTWLRQLKAELAALEQKKAQLLERVSNRAEACHNTRAQSSN